MNRGRAKLVTNRIVRSKWRSPYPFYRPSSDGTRFTATRGNMYPTHHPLCGTIIQICDRQTTNIITPSPSPMFSFPFTLFQRSSRESSRHDSTTILSRDEEKFFDSSTRRRNFWIYPFPFITSRDISCCFALLNISLHLPSSLSFSTDCHARILATIRR